MIWTQQLYDLANNVDQYTGNITAKVENFKLRGGKAYMLSLDREVGKHVDTKEKARAEAEPDRPAESGQPEPNEEKPR